MCKLRQKFLAFEYIVQKALDYTANDLSDDGKLKELNQKIAEYGMVRWMKILYFVTLHSALTEDDQGNPDLTLINLFDNLVAYPNGPVEDGIYRSRAKIDKYTTTLTFDGALKVKMPSGQGGWTLFKGYTSRIDMALTALAKSEISGFDKEMLVQLSHSFPAWKACSKGEDLYKTRGVSDWLANSLNLRQELGSFREYLSRTNSKE